ncbi:glycosyltransferase family 1 protein [Brevundimonas sp. G8]|uniref:glycosyltransferase family 4 protein n=1 Tax=Brevundimonas sp. G8 TaxID=1350776 RepID=UPI0012F0D406|nr:glycosyltransferase family 1 protein [Brevundimonas sp. G8]VXC01611.1 Glycosyl transferase family 1 [Brevundimonas sp. G8]
MHWRRHGDFMLGWLLLIIMTESLVSAICIDGFNLALPKGSGIATYSRNLLTAFNDIGISGQVLYGPPAKDSRKISEVTLADAIRQPAKGQKLDRFKRTAMSQFGRSAYPIVPSDNVIWSSRGGGRPQADCFWAAGNLFHYAHRCFQAYGQVTPVAFEAVGHVGRPDAVQWTATLPLYAKNSANIYTIHDLIPLRLPHTTMEDKQRYLSMCEFIAKKADHIAVVSETTKNDVVKLLGVSADRVTNTYQSVSIPESISGRSQDEVALEVEGVFDLGWKDYFLYYGAIEPKKNVGRIVEAYLASGVERPLVIVGGRAWLEEGEISLLDQVQRDGTRAGKRIRRYEYMPYSMLISLVRGARATLFPSLYEGFGLPVLESMILDTAVLTSTGGALHEVASDAAFMVDPYDVPAITKGIQALAVDDDLVDELVRRGRVRAAAFSPQAHADRVRTMYAGLGLV